MTDTANSKLKAYLSLLRPHQYVKNGFVLLPLFFGHRLFDPDAFANTVFTALMFCIAASSVYIFNDIHDIAEDRNHPIKKQRPLAAGTVPLKPAFLLMVALSIAACLAAYAISAHILLIILGYLALNILYSWKLKHIAIIDITIVASGYLLRIYAGGIAADVAISHWIIVMTFLLTLFIALGKRRSDVLLNSDGVRTRKSIDGYNLEFISMAMVIMAAVTIVSYILYTVSPEVLAKHDSNDLYLTSFWVIIGVLRYLQVAFVKNDSGAPTRIVLKDIVMQIIILLWFGSFCVIFYLK
jgi:4-hydroxybenzoate polyprenyltransferase